MKYQDTPNLQSLGTSVPFGFFFLSYNTVPNLDLLYISAIFDTVIPQFSKQLDTKETI